MFSEHPKSKFWSKRNSLKPDNVALNSHKKFWFDCECGHEFDIQLNNINILGRWCPYCANKKMCDKNKKCITCIDKSIASIEYSKNWSDKNIDSPFVLFKNSHKKYWFECPKCEHSFEQHWKQVSKWKTPQHNRKRDLYKMKCANENCFSVIRIIQKDIFKNNYDWLNELCENIEKISNEKIVQNIYMCKNNEYKDFDC